MTAVRKSPRENAMYALRHVLHAVQGMVSDEHGRSRRVDLLHAQERRAVPGARRREP